MSTTNIFVHENLQRRLKYFSFQPNIIPSGVNLDLFRPIPKLDARNKLWLDNNYKYILFSSSFDNKIKNAPLAKLAIKDIKNTILIELKNYKRSEVNLLLNAVYILLVTSHS